MNYFYFNLEYYVYILRFIFSSFSYKIFKDLNIYAHNYYEWVWFTFMFKKNLINFLQVFYIVLK